MRVLTVIDSLAVGGAERSLAAVSPNLAERGVDLHVAYLVDRPGVGPDLEAAGVALHDLTRASGRLGNVRLIADAIRALRPDLVHTTLFESDIAGRVAARLTGTPVVSSFVTEAYGPEHYGNPEYKRWRVWGAHMSDALTARLVARFHAVSAATAAVMAERLGISRSKIDVVPRGRSQAKLGERSPERRADVRSRLGVPDGVPLVLAAGRHYHMKGLDVLVSAFSHVRGAVPEARLLIAGRKGPSTPHLERLIGADDLGGSVELLGYRSDVPDLMCGADVFVLPSRAEGSPGALIEAMALELPAVASDIPSVAEIGGDTEEIVELFPVESVTAAAEAIVTLLQNPGLAQARAQRGRDRYLACYTLDRVADRMVEFFKRSID